MDTLAFFTVLPFVLMGLLGMCLVVWIAKAVPDAKFVDEWCRAHALVLTDANRPLVVWYLGTAGTLRRIGAVGGGLLCILSGKAFGFESSGPFGWHLWAFVGYLVGALYAELSLVRRTPGGRRVASLVPREVRGYLPARLLWAQRALGALAVVGAGLGIALPRADGFRSFASLGPPDAVLAAVGLAGGLLGIGLEPLQRWLVRRPQPFTADDLIAADDAIRSQAVHSVSGSGLAVLLLLLSTECLALFSTDVQFFRWTMWAPAFFGVYLSIWACSYYGHRAWRVRRQSTATSVPA